jgi:hypothetical protein
LEVTTMNNDKTETKTTNSYPFTSKAQIKARLGEDADFRLSCLTVLYSLQTAHEQEKETTESRNRRGFMSSHAVHGTRIAKKVAAGEEITGDDWAKINAIVPRYTKQLAAYFRAGEIEANPELAETAKVFGV